jgi:hypothetical protein
MSQCCCSQSQLMLTNWLSWASNGQHQIHQQEIAKMHHQCSVLTTVWGEAGALSLTGAIPFTCTQLAPLAVEIHLMC